MLNHVYHFASSFYSSSHNVVFVEELLDRIVACNDKLGMHKWSMMSFDFCVFNWIFVHPDLEQVAESIGV